MGKDKNKEQDGESATSAKSITSPTVPATPTGTSAEREKYGMPP